ncbi:MAG: rhomboid family intramembrane serine protease [Thermoguttaceae bacterium]|nr:rhomboid family intramembrane serine protease [Thermoguttaceae bacterium]MDW8039147.1 rhomboid family intramembrane serine protease [Thermoguttaceae bacterium]
MGVYDRDYYRDYGDGSAEPGLRLRLPQTAVGWLILINVAVWVVDAFTPAREGAGQGVGRWLSDQLAISGQTIHRPWLWWQWISYGFAHSPVNFWHILGNMLGLFFFGRDVEWRYGRAEFVRLYLVLLFLAGLAWSLWHALFSRDQVPLLYGASGAVTGIILLFALLYPHRTVLLFFVIPVPAWVLGVLLIVSNVMGSLDEAKSQVAYGVHLVGAAVAFAYHRFGWHFGRMFSSLLPERLRQWARQRRFRVYYPSEPSEEASSWTGPVKRPHPWENQSSRHEERLLEESEDRLAEQVDRILAKISQSGEASLTPEERRILEEASRQYQRRRRAQRENHHS